MNTTPDYTPEELMGMVQAHLDSIVWYRIGANNNHNSNNNNTNNDIRAD